MAALFNGQNSDAGNVYADLDQVLWKAAGEVKNWPEDDLFEQKN
jgi:hypothetical protein